MKLDEGVAVKALVVDSTGAPIENAHIVAQTVARGSRIMQHLAPQEIPTDEPASESEWGMATTGKDGAVRLAGLDTGNTVFRAACPGYITSDEQIVTLKKNGNGPIKFVLPREASTTVWVKDAKTGEILSKGDNQFRASIWDPNHVGWVLDMIDIGNRYQNYDLTVEHIPPGKQYIIVQSMNAAASHDFVYYGDETFHNAAYYVGDFRPGENKDITILVEKRAKGSIKGKLQGTKELPLQSVGCVILSPLRSFENKASQGLVLTLKSDGNFAAEVTPGDYSVCVRNIDNQIIGLTYIRVEKGKETTVALPLAVLPEGGPVDVTVVDANGTPVTRCKVSLNQLKDNLHDVGMPALFGLTYSPLVAVTDAKGRCRFDKVLAGRIRVYAEIRRCWFSSEMDLAPGKPASARIEGPPPETAPTTTIQGRIVPPPSSRCMVRLQPGDAIGWDVHDTTANEDGTFTFDKVWAGKFKLIATTHDYRKSFYENIEVKQGVSLKNVEVKFPTKFQKIAGRFTGYRFTGYTDFLVLEGNWHGEIPLRPDGTFEGFAPAGKYAVQLHRREYYEGSPLLRTTEINIVEKDGMQNIELR